MRSLCLSCRRLWFIIFLFGDIFYLMNTRFLNQCRCNGIQDNYDHQGCFLVILYWIKLILIITILYKVSITFSFFYVIDLIEYNTMSYFDHYTYYYPDYILNVLRDFLSLDTVHYWSSLSYHYEFSTLIKMNIIVRVIASYLWEIQRQRYLSSPWRSYLYLIIVTILMTMKLKVVSSSRS